VDDGDPVGEIPVSYLLKADGGKKAGEFVLEGEESYGFWEIGKGGRRPGKRPADTRNEGKRVEIIQDAEPSGDGP